MLPRAHPDNLCTRDPDCTYSMTINGQDLYALRVGERLRYRLTNSNGLLYSSHHLETIERHAFNNYEPHWAIIHAAILLSGL